MTAQSTILDSDRVSSRLSSDPDLPTRGGVSLKPEHFRTILDTRPDVGFFEVHAENYMVPGGAFHHYLGKIREDYPLSLHGVGLSIGSDAPLDTAHLARLRALIVRYEPAVFSEHLAWSTHNSSFLNDLLPLPYTPQTLERVCDHIDQVQNTLRREMLLENPSTYLEFSSSSILETEFIRDVIRRTGCKLLLDVNNVHVSCANRGDNARTYIRGLPLDAVEEIHLAGYTEEVEENGLPLIIDSHDSPVSNDVWSLYDYTISLVGPKPTLIERDGNLPAFDVLATEARYAEACMINPGTQHLRAAQ